MQRISVAALAPLWEVPGEFCGRVAVLNHASYLSGSNRSTDQLSASAFGGAVLLDDDEIEELGRLSAVLEATRSRDARLLVPDDRIEAVISWFLARAPGRWTPDVLREVEEEALFEGEPILELGQMSTLEFFFQRVARVTLGPNEIRSRAAEACPTTYLWWIYRVQCPLRILNQLRRSARVILPTEEQIATRKAGSITLSASLAY
jgi:hypothetical protein